MNGIVVTIVGESNIKLQADTLKAWERAIASTFLDSHSPLAHFMKKHPDWVPGKTRLKLSKGSLVMVLLGPNEQPIMSMPVAIGQWKRMEYVRSKKSGMLNAGRDASVG